MILENAIDLFFEENKYDSVLLLLDSDELSNQPNNINSVTNIFKAAALAEMGRADSAKAVLQKIHLHELDERSRYYFQSTIGLVEFRLDNYNGLLVNSSPLINNDAYDLKSLALNERLVSRVMFYYGNYNHAIRLLHRSNNHYSEAGLHKSVAINRKFLANIFASSENWSDAIENINLALETLEKENEIDELFYLYTVASRTYYLMNDSKMSREFINKALNTGDYSNDKQKLASISVSLGNIEKQEGNYQNAIDLYNRVIDIEDYYFGSNKIKVETYIGLANLYNSIGDYDEAVENAQLALSNINSDQDFFYKTEVYNELAMAYLYDNPTLTKTYIDSAREYSKKDKEQYSVDLSDYIGTQIALNEGIIKIAQLSEANKRNRIIAIATAILLILLSLFFVIIGKMKMRVKEAMIELISQNLSKIKSEKRANEVINKKIEISQNPDSHNLSKDDKNFILFTDFNRWLENSKAYLNPQLDLNTASRELGTNRSYLSQSINSQGMNFTEYINKYRIKEVLAIFEDQKNDKNSLTLQELSSEVGFNSKSAFFNTFRKETGMTPVQFKEHIRLMRLNDN